jgi:hypothetical protein
LNENETLQTDFDRALSKLCTQIHSEIDMLQEELITHFTQELSRVIESRCPPFRYLGKEYPFGEFSKAVKASFKDFDIQTQLDKASAEYRIKKAESATEQLKAQQAKNGFQVGLVSSYKIETILVRMPDGVLIPVDVPIAPLLQEKDLINMALHTLLNPTEPTDNAE